MVITFKELSLIAELHYGKLPAAFKHKASEFFDSLDHDGDGVVTLQELLDSNLAGKFGEEFIQHVFFGLDEESKGTLEFRECLSLYYLCTYSTRICAACQRNIPYGLGYTCRTCLKEGQPPNNEFCVCLECFSSHNYQHGHGPPHFFHDFVLFDNLLHSRQISPREATLAPVRIVEQTMKQCVICGDYHESRVRGFTCDVHMSPMRGSPEFVCEWCFSYLCSKCGNLFRDSSTRAEPGKWLQRFVCPACHQNRVTPDTYDASLKRIQRALSGAELLRQCKTCEIKQRNGTLFWYVNGTNTAPTAAASPASQPAWQAPALNPRPRGGLFEQQQQMHSRNSSSGSSSDGPSFRSSQDSRANRVNTQQAAPPRGAPGRGAPINRPNGSDVAAAAARRVNRFVNSAAANLLNIGGPGGGGGGGGAGGGGAGGGDPGDAALGAGSYDMGTDAGGGGDGGNVDNGDGGSGSGGLLASLGNLMGGGGEAGGGFFASMVGGGEAAGDSGLFYTSTDNGVTDGSGEHS